MVKKYLNALADERGFLLAKAVLVTAILSGAVLLFSGRLRDILFVSSKTERSYREKNVLSSTLSYAQYLLANKVCVADKTALAKDDCDPLTDPGSLERLLLLPTTVNDIRSRFSLEVIPLNKLKFRIDKNAITASHPIYSVLQSVNSDKLLVKYKSERDTSKGKMVTVTIRVELYLKSEDEPLAAERVVQFTSQSVNQYSLVLNRNLAIGKEGAKYANHEGDEGRKINFFKNITVGGMVFDSPTFINGDLLIPDSSMKLVEGSLFNSKVNLGGKLYSYGTDGKRLFTPREEGKLIPLGQYPSYEGLRGGIFRDRYERALANIFSNKYAGVVQDETMIKCIEYTKRRYDTKSTRHSRIVVKKEGTGKYLIGLTKLNEFLPVSPSDDDWKTPEHSSLTFSGIDKKPNLSLTVDMAGKDVSFLLGPGYKVEINSYLAGFTKFKDSSGSEEVKKIESEKQAELKKLEDDFDHDIDKLDKDLDDGVISNSEYNKKKKERKDSYEEDRKDLIALYDKKINDAQKKIITKAPVISFELQDLDRSSQRLLNTSVQNESSDFEWNGNLTFKIKVFNLRTPQSDKSSKDYMDFNRFVDVGKSSDGPNYQKTDQDKKLVFQVNGSNKSKLEQPGSSAGGKWSELPYFKKIDYENLSEDEKDSLSDSPTDWEELCASYTMEDADEATAILDFSESAFTSWNYNPVSRKYQFKPYGDSKVKWSEISSGDMSLFLLNSLYINNSNQSLFHVYSVVDRCVVEPTANIVMGFLVCRQLHIKPRKEPLKMVGTFVVDYLKVADSAVNNGITWTNVFHRDSIALFKKYKLLPSDKKCSIDPSRPLWSPKPTPEDMVLQKECSPYSITRLSDPFTWSSFNPSCGLESSDSLATVCKPYDRIDKFFMNNLGESYE